MQKFLDYWSFWLVLHGIEVVGIILGAYLVGKFTRLIAHGLVRRLLKRHQDPSPSEQLRREETLVRVISSTLGILIWPSAVMMILAELGVEIVPLVAATGIIGIALGFGGQAIIRDIFAGLFIIVEDQYRVGDLVVINGAEGIVEDTNLRVTVLRDLDGSVHNIPNGTITTAVNRSKIFARINLDVCVGYDSDIDAVAKVVDRVGLEMAEDPAWKEKIIRPPHFARVHDFGESAVVIKILGTTHPLEHWRVAGEVRKRLKAAFQREGITMPLPQRVIHYTPPAEK